MFEQEGEGQVEEDGTEMQVFDGKLTLCGKC